MDDNKRINVTDTIKSSKKVSVTLNFIVFFFLSGCSLNRLGDPLSLNEIRSLVLKNYIEDYSTTINKGLLYIISQPPSQQLLIHNYNLSIGNHKTTIYKNSITKVIIDEGEVIISGRSKAFGLPTKIKVNINSAKPTCIIFQGPMNMLTTGKFWNVECTERLINRSFG